VIITFVVFSYLTWYAYTSQTTKNSDEIIFIEADKTPMKAKPKNPGGKQFPHQDKTVYEVLIGQNKSKTKVERIVKNKIEPIKREKNYQDSWVDKKIPLPSKEKPKPEVISTPKPIEKVDTKTVKNKKVETIKKPVEKPAVKAKAPVLQSRYGVQLGSFKSHEEAKKEWTRIYKGHTDLVHNLGHKIIKAQVKNKGTYYRLRAHGLADVVEAKALCASFAERRQPCFPVKMD
jgi:hypothetical protein